MRNCPTVIVSGALLAASCTKAARVEPVSAEEAREWLRWVIPLPKRVRFQGKLTLPASDLSFRLRPGATDVERAALDELTGLVAQKESGRRFPILIGVCDADGRLDGTRVPGADELAGLKNADQAYVITPLPGRSGPLAVRTTRPGGGLAVTALTDRGVYHGVKTLQQLLEPRLAALRPTQDGDTEPVEGVAGGPEGRVQQRPGRRGKVTLPMVVVLDWPDLAERGEWGGSATRDVRYFADRKLNLIEAHSRLALDDQGRGVATIDAKRQEDARLHAIKWVPIITHLDQLGRTGIYERYPELRGKGPKAKHGRLRAVAPCLSQPKTAEILADWFVSLATTKGVEDVCVWLSEHHVHCGCPTCEAQGQYTLEAEACVRAWRLARKKSPNVRLRILLTQGSYSTNDKVLAAASPSEVGITYYDGGRTYDSSRDPMIYPLLEEFARRGRWLGCYPQLTASWRVVCPWSGPQFIKYRMTEFVDKDLECLCGYATPDNRFYDFNVTAAAEWSWNAHGRTEREFALAWATRRRLSRPEKVAEWAVTLGPVGWDVYGSRIPYNAFFGHATRLIRDRKRPALGKGMFRYFPTAGHIDRDLAVCDEAMKLAREIADPAILAETETLRGYVTMVKSVHTIASAVAGKKKPDAVELGRLQASFDELSRAGLDVADGLRAWQEAAAPGGGGSRFADTANVTHQTVTGIAEALAPFGVKDSGKPRRPHRIGSWKTRDFDEKEDIQKKWDVTSSIDGVGTYRVRFAYTRGWNGLTMHGVALAAAAVRRAHDGRVLSLSKGAAGKEAPDELTEVAADRHAGAAAHRNRANTYVVKLLSYDPTARYFLLADIKGVTSRGRPPARQGCEGDVWLVKQR